MNGTSQSWKQVFQYDRFGNHTFNTDPAKTTANALSSLLTIDPANNRFTAGQPAQQKLFVTYVEANYDLKDSDSTPFALGIWDSSAAVANGRAKAGPNSNLLNQGQLTAFAGVTSMMDFAKVIDKVASITKIVGYETDNGFRVFGQLNDMDSAETVKDKFDGFFGGIGKGEGEYGESHRERSAWKVPNGQFKMVPESTRIDVDKKKGSGLRFCDSLDAVICEKQNQAMARKPRVEVEGGLCHVITRGNNRQPIFNCDDDYQKFLSLLENQKRRLPFFLCAYYLMSNHVHLLLERQADAIGRIMHRMLSGYSQ